MDPEPYNPLLILLGMGPIALLIGRELDASHGGERQKPGLLLWAEMLALHTLPTGQLVLGLVGHD